MKNLAQWMLALASLLALNIHAADGFNAEDWKHRQKTLIDTTAEGVELKQGASQLPLALRLHTGNFPFAEAKPDGSDLRVTAGDGKTPLRFHIEKYDATNELAVVWVQQPKLSPAAKTDALTLLWGNDKATAAGDAKGSYDAPQNLVLHFSDNGPLRDSTGNGNHPREITVKAVPGPLGDAASLGFVVETERQVERHLASHLDRLPAADRRSRAIVDQMKLDESQHADAASQAGAAPLPAPVRWLMRGVAKVMTTTAERF